MNSKWGHLFFLTLLSAALFFSAIGSHDLWPADEPRFAEVAREMMQTGDYLVPRVNGQPYKEKPPLLFWAIAAASAPFGDVTEFSARVPSALAGMLTILCTYLLAARLYDRRVALWSAVILALCQRFWWQSLTAQIDMLLTGCLALALLSFWLWHRERNKRWLAMFYGAIAAAVYAKGPPGLVFPILLVVTFYFRRREQRCGLHFTVGLLAVILAISAWLIPARMAISSDSAALAQGVLAGDLYQQIVGRFLEGGSKAQPPWYYLINLPLDWLPWSLFLPWSLPWVWRRRKEGEPMRLLLSWTVPAFIFFSICTGKRAIYLLPLAPALAILYARSILDLMDGARVRWRRWTARVWAGLLMVVGAAPFGVLLSEYRELWNPSLLLFSLVALAGGAHTLYRSFRGELRNLHAMVAVHFALLALVTGVLVFPIVDNVKSARFFCQPVRQLAQNKADFDLYSMCFSREEYVFYSNHFHDPIWRSGLPLGREVKNLEEQFPGIQRRLRWAIPRAVEGVALTGLGAVREDELGKLQQALRGVLEKEGLGADLQRQLEGGLAESVQEFFASFESDRPAFMFVQKRDWRWMLALYPEARNLAILRNENVGKRSVLLIANRAAAALAKG